MQTRRKSLSLTSLGITLPKRNRTVSHPSPPSTIAEENESDRPSKKTRLMSPTRGQDEKSKLVAQLSPPPSPKADSANKVDIEGINDDIVVGTIQQLEQTGNRPHLVKELAAVLTNTNHSVAKSANQAALISSRLHAYMQRGWPTISKCPLEKQLSPVHPRRLYFFLTTMPRQPIPEYVEPTPKVSRIISPSLSSASAMDEEDERYNRSRDAMSPSPEVDLTSPELEEEDAQEPPTPGAPFSKRNSVARSRSASASNLSHNRRGASPQLEHEERDFKQTANALYEQALQRRNSQHSQEDVNMEQADTVGGAEQETGAISMSIEESEESVALKNSEVAASLFGHADYLKATEPSIEMFSSPVIQASKTDRRDEQMEAISLDVHPTELSMADWEGLQSPENVELAELDDLFDAY